MEVPKKFIFIDFEPEPHQIMFDKPISYQFTQGLAWFAFIELL